MKLSLDLKIKLITAKLKHAVSGPQSANVNSTDDNDFEVALEEEAYSSAHTQS